VIQGVAGIEEALRAFPRERFAGMRRGIEKESLRTLADGSLALTPHPAALGSALTNPRITTDFSESQLELITAAHATVEECLAELREIHQFVYRAIGDEMLWVGSMPCGLPSDETIPIARYGSSNIARAKSVYRTGLAYRYGRRMQAISGIHYNWSIPGVSSQGYFDLIRNFRRHSFLLLVLFGASPAVCGSFVAGRAHGLQPLHGNTLGLPHATSLRMGRLGYQSDAQASLGVSYNNLETYAASLEKAMTSSHPAYEAIGIRSPGGEYNQLSTSLLQIENEFYGTIRPKRVVLPGERPLHALRERGVEYVEVRCMDLNPLEPIGIGAPTARFIDIFLLHCLLAPSPPDSAVEFTEISHNQQTASERGRAPGVALLRDDGAIPLAEWAVELLGEMAPIADALDRDTGAQEYQEALAQAVESMYEPALLPSARVLECIARDHDGSFLRFTRGASQRTRDFLLGEPWSGDQALAYARLAATSVADQEGIECSDEMEFEAFRQRYVSTERLRVAP
jgi:glutamate--cysteine ligase